MKLNKKQISGLYSLYLVFDRFTPIQLLEGINSEIVDQLVELRLAEKGEVSDRYKQLYQYENGYRLTEFGRDYLYQSPDPNKDKLLLCILTGPVINKKSKHIVYEHDKQPVEMPTADFLIIDGTGDAPGGSGVYLWRFDRNGDCVGDTWHPSSEQAKFDAAKEYECLIHEWTEIPKGVDMVEYGLAQFKKVRQ